MNFSDETLMAYVDGELDDEARTAVAAAVAADPDVAQRVAREEALRTSVQAAFVRVLQEPVPERLLRAVGSAPPDAQANNVTELAGARAARAQKQPQTARLRGIFPRWGAIAASLILGAIAGQHFLDSTDAGPFAMRAGQLVARGALAQALSMQLASTQTQGSAVQIGSSFLARSGQYCRTFALGQQQDNEHVLAGLACRDHGTWRVDVLAPRAGGTSGGYRMAGSELPKAVLQAMDEQIAGEPLDARAEAAARRREWQP